jgi:hypothetical protein
LVLQRPTLVLLAAAMLLLSPNLVIGTHVTHSSAQNLTWATQFASQFQAGILYPRWTPDSFDGLGGAGFYFYPPMAFWMDSVVSVFTGNLLSLSYRLALTSILILFASGLTMRAWLLRATQNRQVALWGAVAYMAAPYHMIDHYMRGAFAEFAAYALLPPVMLGIRLIADRRRAGPPVLALSYAGLVMAHLPTALLATCTVVSGYALFRLRGFAALLRCAGAGALGLGLAAIYLVPSLALQDWISAEQWWTPFFLAENWYLLTPARWPEPHIMIAIAALALASALIASGLCVIVARLPSSDPRRLELSFWIAASFVCLVLMAGLVPWFWQIGIMAKVQFPWRLMLVLEFSLVTSLCLAPFKGLPRVVLYLFTAAAVVSMPAVALVADDTVARVDFTLQRGEAPQGDMKPNEPRGFPHNPKTGYTELGLKPLANVPAIACVPAATLCRAEAGRFGDMRIEIDSDAPVAVTVRRFFFPAWRVERASTGALLPVVPTEPYRLVSFTVPAGGATYALRRIEPPIEWWARGVSGLALLLLVAWAALTRRRTQAPMAPQSTLR